MSKIKHINLPTPKEVGHSKSGVDQEKYQIGWDHGLQSNTLEGKMLKYSYRMGFRAAKLFLKEERSRRGIIQLPVKWKFKFKSKEPE